MQTSQSSMAGLLGQNTQSKWDVHMSKTDWSVLQKLWEDSEFILSRAVTPSGCEPRLLLVPIVFLTSLITPEEAKDGRRVYGHRILPKPATRSELIELSSKTCPVVPRFIKSCTKRFGLLAADASCNDAELLAQPRVCGFIR